MSDVEDTDDHGDTTPRTVPVSPNTGLDPEFRAFANRVMLGYESAHRTIAELAESMARSARESQEATSRAIQMHIKYAEEREELVSKRHRRELEAESAKMLQENRAAIARDIRALLSAGGKRLLGIPLTGDDSHGLQDLLATFSGEQIDDAMSGRPIQLTDAQRQLLMAIFSSLADSEKPKAAE